MNSTAYSSDATDARDDDLSDDAQPPVSAVAFALSVAAYVLWLAFLAWMAAQRWFGGLQ